MTCPACGQEERQDRKVVPLPAIGRRVYYEVVVKVKGRQEVSPIFTDCENAWRVYGRADQEARRTVNGNHASGSLAAVDEPAALLLPGFTAGPDPDCSVCQYS